MQALLETRVDETELAAATVEAVTDFLKASAPTPPALAAIPTVKASSVATTPLDASGEPTAPPFVTTVAAKWATEAWEMANGNSAFPIAPEEILDYTPSEMILSAATGWVKPGSGYRVADGTGEPDMEWRPWGNGPITDGEVAAFLEFTAERINRFGWVQGSVQMGDHTCMVGAISLRARQLAGTMPFGRVQGLVAQAHEAVREYLGGLARNPQVTIEAWNDAPGRTKAAVVRAFYDAARELRTVTQWRRVDRGPQPQFFA